MSATPIVQKLWNYCHVLRDDGMSYDDYVEQLTYMLFHKMVNDGGGLVRLVPVREVFFSVVVRYHAGR